MLQSQLTDFVPRPSASREPLPMSLHAGQLLRRGLLLIALGCALSVLALWLLDGRARGTGVSGWMVALLGLAALFSARAADRWLQTLFSLCALACVLAIAAAALLTGWGLATPGLVLPPLLVLAVGAALGARQGAVLALAAAASLLILALAGSYGLGAEAGGAAAGAAAVAGQRPSYAHALLLQWAAIGLGWVAGLLIHRSLQRQVEVARQRENRFRSLLALAADAYWELDADYRITAAVYHDNENRQLTRAGGLGQLPWRLARFVCDHDTLDQLLADLDARVPFRDLPIAWLGTDGQPQRFLVSGEPRFGERGEFTGYWGVARDITADLAAREALLATEARYQELFSRIPTPLVLHRGGRIVEANPAAQQLFEGSELSMLRGADILGWFAPGESRERARQRMEELENLPLGTALPVTDFKLLVQHRPVWVRATGVRVAAQGGPATLSIFIDETERRQAEDAVHRSEALLSHLVATSPDLITLTDTSTGRYVMTNPAFEQLCGHGAAQAVGRTAQELGLWHSEAEHQQFMHTLQQAGSVNDMPVEFVHRDGRRLSLRVSAARFAMDSRDYLVINGRDVTEAERARQEREAILAQASVGIAVTRSRHFVLANRRVEELCGWGPGELLGQPSAVVWLSEADYEDVRRQVGRPLQAGQTVELERPMRRRDGSQFLARVRGRAVNPAQPGESGTVWIVEDVTERREFETALARARDDAEAASRAKSAFLANTSHELRTPLNAMMGLAQLARQPGLDAGQRQQHLDQICESAQGLADIISDILDLSKIEAGRLQLQVAPFDLGALLQSLQRSYATLAAARGLALELHATPEVAGMVWGDALRVRQILTNYLGNAIKFTRSGGVSLHALRLPAGGAGSPAGLPAERVRLEVRDTGEGVAPDVQGRLFQPFTQADESTTRRHGGTGLGLSICRELATLMGGAVGLESRPGQGSCFWAELPLPPVPAAQPPQLGHQPAPAQLGNLQGRRVLIVEDNPVNMMIAVAMMEGWGLDVAQATDGQQAVQAVQQAFDAGQPFDAVLMDVQMPQMSGHEATRALRRTQAGAHLPIIALTAAALVTERTAALEAGMNDFLTKPVDVQRLRAALARWLLPVVS